VRRHALTLAFAVAVIATGSGAPAVAAIGFERSAPRASAQSDLFALINAYRSTNGVQRLSPNGALTAAAAWMATDMAAKNYMGHVSSDGRSPTQRMSAFGYPGASRYTGENLGGGYETASAVLAGWQASPAHNAILLNPSYDALGIGLVYNPNSRFKWYWAADFGGAGGTRRFVPPPAPQPVGQDPAPLQSAEDSVDTEAPALEARFMVVDAKRIAHLLAVLQRMREI
jgi:uncharacterized protein YkwD